MRLNAVLSSLAVVVGLMLWLPGDEDSRGIELAAGWAGAIMMVGGFIAMIPILLELKGLFEALVEANQGAVLIIIGLCVLA